MNISSTRVKIKRPVVRVDVTIELWMPPLTFMLRTISLETYNTHKQPCCLWMEYYSCVYRGCVCILLPICSVVGDELTSGQKGRRKRERLKRRVSYAVNWGGHEGVTQEDAERKQSRLRTGYLSSVATHNNRPKKKKEKEEEEDLVRSLQPLRNIFLVHTI